MIGMGEITSAARLRALPSLAGPLPTFDPDTAPHDPDELFGHWLADAIEAGVVEPQAMTLSTVDPVGRPSARVLILKSTRPGARRPIRTWSLRSGRCTGWWPTRWSSGRATSSAATSGSATPATAMAGCVSCCGHEETGHHW